MRTGVADCTVPTRVWGRSRLTRAPWCVARRRVNLSRAGPARPHHVAAVVEFKGRAARTTRTSEVIHGRQVSEVERAAEKAGCGGKESEEGRRPCQGAPGSEGAR